MMKHTLNYLNHEITNRDDLVISVSCNNDDVVYVSGVGQSVS